MAIYKFPQSEPNFIESWTVTLEAGRPKVIEAYGRTFACVLADAPFKMCFNNGRYFDARRGAEWQLQDDERYNLLKFTSDQTQTIQILTGNFFYHENVVIPLMQVAKTRAFPGASSIAAGANADLDSVPAGFTYRKGVIIGNNDAAVDLDIYAKDAAGAWQLAGTVLHLQAWYAETSDALRIHNGSGGTVNVRILETFYYSQ
jgi:hypothetical protein